MTLKPQAALNKDRTTGAGPVFQHRHFAAVAAIISGLPGLDGCHDGRAADELRRHVAERFAARLASTNPNFAAARFMRACLED